ncbi:hypothetical protein GCM10025883_20250 [Mobilicoccus caccae]|uniref:Uncharacterized protein n=1 Tax=Mobilicoccus caccae TaxID=1859295 RepID=A0ABQ6IPZ3_9MICO|nr:hypothetical protein GCM10025883_20250 [Mobilicoccus caccae]
MPVLLDEQHFVVSVAARAGAEGDDDHGAGVFDEFAIDDAAGAEVDGVAADVPHHAFVHGACAAYGFGLTVVGEVDPADHLCVETHSLSMGVVRLSLPGLPAVQGCGDEAGEQRVSTVWP